MSTDAPQRMAHISDPHFGTEVPEVVEALVADLHEQRPDLIFLTGDITQRARRSQFERAREFLNRLPNVPRLCLPGNHDLPLFDLPRRLIEPYGHYRRYVSATLAPEFSNETVAVIGVDATTPLRHKDGALRTRQILRTASRLRQLQQPFRIVLTHQPLAAWMARDRQNVAHGAERALDQWITAGADLFLGGHIHLPYCMEVRTREQRASGVLLQAGTCVSHRIRSGIPNSYNLISVHPARGERRMNIARRDFDVRRGRFEVAGSHQAWSIATRPGTDPGRWRLQDCEA